MKLYEEFYKKYFKNMEWTVLSNEESYLVGKDDKVVVSHYKRRGEDSVAFQEVSEAEFLAHYNEKGYMLNTNNQTTYDVMDVPDGDTLGYHVISQMAIWVGDEYIEKIKPKLKKFSVGKKNSITLGNSVHPIKKFGLTAKRVRSDNPLYNNWFYLEAGKYIIVIDDVSKWLLVVSSSLAQFKLDVEAGENFSGQMIHLDPTNKYIGNDILKALEDWL